MLSIRKAIVSALALGAFATGGAAALATAGVAIAAPADREVGVTAVYGDTDPHGIQAATDPGNTTSGTPVSTDGTRIW